LGKRKILHQRKSMRLKGYDYSKTGLYFITICCQDKVHRFGNVVNGKMILNEFGEIAHNEWEILTHRFLNFELDVFQIMPDHMHGIIELKNLSPTAAGTEFTSTPNPDQAEIAPNPNQPQVPTPKVPDIVGAYKSLVANGCLLIYKSRNETMGKLWQRNYYERIIRNEQSYHRISEYIIKNPAKWEADKIKFKRNSQ